MKLFTNIILVVLFIKISAAHNVRKKYYGFKISNTYDTRFSYQVQSTVNHLINYVTKFPMMKMNENQTKIKKLDNTNELDSKMVSPNAIDGCPEFDKGKEAERRIQDFFVIQAWRHQRQRNNQLENNVKNLTNQVDSLQLQIYTLKQLLDAEKARVVHVNTDLRKILSALEECNHEKRSLIKEREQLELRLHLMEDRIVGLENECKNQRNELITSRSEAQNWEKQLEKEREKLIKMKDERKFFIDEDIQEIGEESKETNGSNSRKTSRDSRVKSSSCKSGKKNSGRGREERGVGKVDFRKNVGCIKKLLKESLSLFDEPD